MFSVSVVVLIVTHMAMIPFAQEGYGVKSVSKMINSSIKTCKS